MAIYAKGGKGGDRDYSPTPAGTFQAVVFNVWDIGMQVDEYKGQTKTRHKVAIGFELVGQKYESGEYAGKPITKYKTYSSTLYKNEGLAGLIPMLINRQLTEHEINSGFDLEQLVGKNCTLTIIHKVSQTSGNTYATIQGIGGLMTGLKPALPTIARDYLPAYITELQAKAVSPQAVQVVTPEQQASPAVPVQQMMSKEEMHWQIKDWINAGKVKETDVKATMRLVGKSKDWKDYTYDEATALFIKVERLAKANDITAGTGFNPEPVTPPAF